MRPYSSPEAGSESGTILELASHRRIPPTTAPLVIIAGPDILQAGSRSSFDKRGRRLADVDAVRAVAQVGTYHLSQFIKRALMKARTPWRTWLNNSPRREGSLRLRKSPVRFGILGLELLEDRITPAQFLNLGVQSGTGNPILTFYGDFTSTGANSWMSSNDMPVTIGLYPGSNTFQPVLQVNNPTISFVNDGTNPTGAFQVTGTMVTALGGTDATAPPIGTFSPLCF